MKRLALLLGTLFMLLAPASAYAFNPLSGACGSGGNAATSTACADNGTNNPIAGPNGVLMKASLIISTIAGIAAVIVIIVSGFQFILSNGDPQKIASARSAIIGSVVGLVIIAAAESIILFVVSKL